MKILRISLNNIASLAGQHTVDFTQEPLKSAGLYAISGDTGSGKSSLLDALCLALYGKTPRLRDSKSSLEKINNEEKQLDPRTLLRRGTAEGMAEVAFIGVDGKPWTARWTVRRARRNVSGKLQQVDRTLFQGHIEPASDGTIESGGKKTEVDAAIQEKLGLTFEQFTRAVLLAQNEFAVFLKSDDKARAEILQALTGTGRFADLSKAVFERCKAERKVIEELQAGLKGSTVFSDEQRIEKQTQLADINRKLDELRQQQKLLEADREWHSKLSGHNRMLETTETALSTAQKTLTDSQPRKQHLKWTEQALRHAAPLKQTAVDAAAHLTRCETEASAAISAMQQHEEKAKQATAASESAQRKLKHRKQQADDLQPRLIQAAKLDESLRLQEEGVAKSINVLTKVTAENTQTAKQLQDVSELYETAAAEQKQLQQQQQELACYQPFLNAVELWSDRLTQAAETQSKSATASRELQQCSQRLSTLQEQQKHADETWQQLSQELESTQSRLKECEDLAGDFDRDELSQQQDAQQNRREIWTTFQTHLLSIQDLDRELEECSQRLKKCNLELVAHQKELQELVSTAIPSAQQLLEAQESSLKTVQSAISNEAVRLRLQLQDDQACSVCGSTHHPYSAKPPSADEAAVKALQRLVNEAEQLLEVHRRRQTTLEAELQANTIRQQEYETQQQQRKQERSALTFAHAEHEEIQPLHQLATPKQLAEADRNLKAIDQHLRELKAQHQQAAEAEKAVAAVRKSLEALQNQERLAKERATGTQQTLATAEADHKHLQQRVSELKTQQENQRLSLQELFAAVPGSQDKFESSPVTFRKEFSEAILNVSRVAKRLSEVDASIKQASDRLETIRPLAETAAVKQKTAQKEADETKARFTELQQELLALFEGRSADFIKRETTQQLKEAEEQQRQTEKTRLEAERSLATASQNVTAAEKQRILARQKLTLATAALATWREKFNADNNVQLSESDLNQMLDRNEVWLKSESESLDALTAAVQTKTGEVETLKRQQKAILEDRPSERTLEEVTSQQEATQNQMKDFQNTKEDLQRDLNVDDAQRKKSQDLQQQIADQEIKATPWIRLNDVIGSSDGSSFRNIAQRHTLDILLQFSNYQLRLLSGRYRLERIPNSLNLMVVDQDMADERRSIHSLSGGESFLVSLALALGLASLTSNRLKIESLFIDEGFGSLDPNTLDLAMNALIQLESQGRKVGVISHVTTMTDAIPVQVKVEKGSNGASTIRVPTLTSVHEKRSAEVSSAIQQSLFAEPSPES